MRVGMQACWQPLEGICVSGKHSLCTQYVPRHLEKRREQRPIYGVTNSIFMHRFPYVHLFAKFPHRSSGEFLFPFFKSALIEGDASISCVFLRLVADMVTLVKLRSSNHDQGYCFFVAARRGRRASRHQGRRCGLVRHGFLARPVLGKGLIHDT